MHRLTSRFDTLELADYRLPPRLDDRLTSPALVIYLERVRDNIRRVIAMAGGRPDRWRPHVKTAKIPRIFEEYLDAGVRNFKCATVRECRTLLETFERRRVEGADVLLAYPLVGPAVGALAKLAAAHPRTKVSVLSEDPRRVAGLPRGLGVFVDINPGMHRSGIPVDDEAAILGVARGAGSRLRGLHYYEGHLHGSPESRRTDAFAAYERALEWVRRLGDEGLPVEELVTSGTPTFGQALAFPGFDELAGTRHRISPGTVVFHDFRSEQEIADLELSPAAVVFSRVVSHPARGRFTCDAGSKALAAEAGDPCAYILGHPGWVAGTPSEEHLPVDVREGQRPQRGRGLLLVPRHVCPTVNLAERALLVDGRELTVVDVEARAHDLELS